MSQYMKEHKKFIVKSKRRTRLSSIHKNSLISYKNVCWNSIKKYFHMTLGLLFLVTLKNVFPQSQSIFY